MAIHRVFVPPRTIRGSTITIDDPNELHHIRDVLRLGRGDALFCLDGQGREYRGTIVQATGVSLTVQIDRTTRLPSQGAALWLAQGLPRADRFDWVVQKATELGVGRLSPLITQHTVVRVTAQQGRRKWLRWQRIAREAAKQCGRPTLPIIDPPQSFDGLLPTLQSSSLVLLPTLAVRTTPLREVLQGHVGAREVAILIGPEGDFSHEEVTRAKQYGAQPVSLGSLTLRTETAAIATLAILRYALDSG